MTTTVPFGRRGVRPTPPSTPLNQPKGSSGSPPPTASGEAGSGDGRARSAVVQLRGAGPAAALWLASIGAQVVLGVLLAVVNLAISLLAGDAPAGVAVRLFFTLAVEVVACWITLALEVKRWHDRDKSWVWLFVGFIPLIGWLWVLIECGFLDGTPGANRFGPSPKGLGDHRLTASASY